MARQDDRRIITVKADREGVPQLSDIQDAVRQLCEMVYKLEGRVGQIELRDGLKITEDTVNPLALASNVTQFANFNIFFGRSSTLLQTADVYLVSGARLSGAQWNATHTVSTMVKLNAAGGVEFFSDTNLTVGQVFVPTQVGSFPEV